MLILGLAGEPGVGKDTVGDYLIARYGFVKFAFSDALYAEVQAAYGLEDQTLLRDRSTKDTPQDRLALVHCRDTQFSIVASAPGRIPERVEFFSTFNQPLSPREVLQWWGTEFRRAQNERYWLDRARDFILSPHGAKYPEHRPQFFVETGTRFDNEQDFIHMYGGNVWHVYRDGLPPPNAHTSNKKLAVLDGEREIWNNDTIDRLHFGVDLLLSTGAQYVKVEPLEPMLTVQESSDILFTGEKLGAIGLAT